MITHKTNYESLRVADDVTFPRMNIQVGYYNTDEGIRVKLKFASKVSVKGRNGERYFVPCFDSFSNIKEDDIPVCIKRFHSLCQNVQDHYITTEGKDVLIEDYNKTIEFNQ
jgi:hypothetical protein